MDSSDLATLALAIATISGVMLGLYVALVAIVWSALASQVSSTQSAAMSLGKVFTNLESRLSPEAHRELWDPLSASSGSDIAAAVRALNRHVLAESFQPRTFQEQPFLAEFHTVSRQVGTCLESVARRAGDRAAASKIAFEVVAELTDFWTEISTTGAIFERTLGSYLVAWRATTGLLTRRSPVILNSSLLLGSLLVAYLATTHSPSIGEHQWVNLSSGFVLIGASIWAVSLLWFQYTVLRDTVIPPSDGPSSWRRRLTQALKVPSLGKADSEVAPGEPQPNETSQEQHEGA